MGDGETPPAKGRPGLKPATVPSPVAVEAPQRPMTAASSVAVEAAPTPVAVETPAAASSATVLARRAVAVAAAGVDVMTLLESDVPKTVLYSDECHNPLKPPVYQCSRMRHVACSDCVIGHGGGGDDDDGDDAGGDDDDDGDDAGGGGDDDGYKCSSCSYLGASAVYVQSSYLDTLFSNTKVACPYKKYGCPSSLAFRDAAAHAAACVFAPCLCPECSFEGSPADLVRHLTEKSGRHAWTAHNFTYGKAHRYAIPSQKSKGKYHELLVAEEDGGVFLLAIVFCGDIPIQFVALVCVRNKASAAPVYSSSVSVEAPPAKGFMVKVEKKAMESCSVPVKYQMEMGRDYFIPVYPGMLHGKQTKKLHVCICIRKTPGLSA